jgi:hypothetical protein
LLGVLNTASAQGGVVAEATLSQDQRSGSFLTRNDSDKAVEVDESKLPWGISDTVWTRVQTFGQDCKELKELAGLDHPPLIRKYVVLEPTYSIRRDVDLLSHWRGRQERPKSCQAVLFWSYELIERSGASLGRYSGAIDLR